MCHSRNRAFFRFWLLSILHSSSAGAQSAGPIEDFVVADDDTATLSVAGVFYVPVYSSVSMSQGKLRADFSVTLSVHNTSESRPLILKRIAYFDTSARWWKATLSRRSR